MLDHEVPAKCANNLQEVVKKHCLFLHTELFSYRWANTQLVTERRTIQHFWKLCYLKNKALMQFQIHRAVKSLSDFTLLFSTKIFFKVMSLTEDCDISQSVVESFNPLSSFKYFSKSRLLIGSSISRISKACWCSFAAY